MSKLFFDHLVILEEVDSEIKKIATSIEEKEEMWSLVDSMVHHKVFDSILSKLSKDDHQEFLELFHKSPHDETLIFNYLKNKIGQNIEEILKAEFGEFTYEILKELKNK